MKKLCAVLLCACLLCLAALPVQATSGFFAKDIENALTFYNRPDLGYRTQVVVGTLGKLLDFEKASYQARSQIREFEVAECVYGNAEDEMALWLTLSDHTGGDYNKILQDRVYLLVTASQPIEHEFPDKKERDIYTIVGFLNTCVFWFEDGTLHGYSPEIVDEILADDPTIDTMDELAEYFEKRIDALQREGKLPPDPVDWPGLLCAAGGLVLLGGLTAVLLRKRNKVVL